MSDAVSFTSAGFGRGFRRGNAFALGVFAYGLAFGLVADQAGFTPFRPSCFRWLSIPAPRRWRR